MTRSGVVNQFRKVTHCIFDMDGLLLDTEKLYTEAAQRVLDRYGKTYTWEVKQTIIGLQTRPMAERMIAAYDLPMTWEEYAKAQRDETEKVMINAELMPDTEPIYEEITRQIAKAFGKSYPQEVRVKVLGTTEQRSAHIAVNDLQLPITVDEYLKRYYKLCGELLGESPLLQGAERLLRHLHAHNVPVALATSSGSDMYDLKTTHHRDLFKLFDVVVCGSTDPEVKEGKPNPDIFLVAASRFADKPEPVSCLVFEDAPNGVTAATAAGMQSIMVPDERIPAEMRAQATLVLKSLNDFKPEQFGLPSFSVSSNGQ